MPASSTPSVSTWSQPVGAWRARGAGSAALRLGMGLTPSDHDALPETADRDGHTLWHYWAEGPHPHALLDVMVKRGLAEARDRTSRDGEHPWHRLAFHGQHLALNAWRQRWGAPTVLTRARSGDSVLAAACWSGCARTVGLVLDAGFEVNTADEQGLTPLMVALHRGDTLTVLALLHAGADPAARDAQGRCALHHAAQHDLIDLVPVLEDAGCNADWVDHGGTSARRALDRCLKLDANAREAARVHWQLKHQQRAAF